MIFIICVTSAGSADSFEGTMEECIAFLRTFRDAAITSVIMLERSKLKHIYSEEG